MTYFTTITSKGTVTIPAKIRKELGMKPGMKVTIGFNKQTGNAEIHKPVDIDDLRKRTKAHLQKLGIPPITDEQIDQAMADAAVERYKRSLT